MNYESNIRACYERATDSDVAAGLHWYENAHTIASQLDAPNISAGAAILAALSPATPWKRNVELAATGCKKGKFSGSLKTNCKKAARILHGESPDTVLGGFKVRAFWAAIASAGHSDVAVIDRHAISIAIGHSGTKRECGYFYTEKRYYSLADSYTNVAREVGLSATQLQAITWVCWRREKGLVD